MCSTTENIQIENRITRKRHRVTLRIPKRRDKRKTQVSTFAHFLHQKDAFIAMKVVNEFLKKGAPVYTVHENFLTVKDVSNRYTDIFTRLGSPIQFLNLKKKEDSFLDEKKANILNERASTEKFLSFLEVEPYQ